MKCFARNIAISSLLTLLAPFAYADNMLPCIEKKNLKHSKTLNVYHPNQNKKNTQPFVYPCLLKKNEVLKFRVSLIGYNLLKAESLMLGFTLSPARKGDLDIVQIRSGSPEHGYLDSYLYNKLAKKKTLIFQPVMAPSARRSETVQLRTNHDLVIHDIKVDVEGL